MTLSIVIGLAVALDYWLGEPAARYHPLVFFGRWANWVERCLLDARQSAISQRLSGVLAVLLVLAPGLLGLFWLSVWPALQLGVDILVVYFCIAARSLQQHALAVHRALSDGDLALGRSQVSKIVSRHTESMMAEDVRRATIESVLENGADAVFAPLFWFVLLGPLGILLYRFSNTLDAMWGYKNDRYRSFGWAAARFDDVLNWIPARLTALSYALLGDTRQAFTAWRTQAALLDSPNAGPVMTAGGGALQLRLGGPAIYHGQLKAKPWFGGEQTPQNADIQRACQLMYKTLILWIIIIALGESLA